jgi:hypothetical protein
MALPQQPLPRRRRQILDDQTGGAHRFDSSEYEDTWAKDTWAENNWAKDSEDNWVKRLIARLAGLIRGVGGRT